VEAAELAQHLVDLAEAAGFEVRSLRGSAPGGAGETASSGVCRVRGSIWVLLDPADPVEDHISVLVAALETHAPAFLEDRYLPPALRQRIRGDGGAA
jgi:hypothetical protein